MLTSKTTMSTLRCCHSLFPDVLQGSFSMVKKFCAAIHLSAFLDLTCADSKRVWPMIKKLANKYGPTKIRLTVHFFALAYFDNAFRALKVTLDSVEVFHILPLRPKASEICLQTPSSRVRYLKFRDDHIETSRQSLDFWAALPLGYIHFNFTSQLRWPFNRYYSFSYPYPCIKY